MSLSDANAIESVIGFRVKSGFAIAVLMTGPIQTPTAVCRRIVELSDSAFPDTRQPYHAAMGVLEEDEDTIRQRTEIVRRAAASSVSRLCDQLRESGYYVSRAGIVVGSQIDPNQISNSHIRAHALEGRLFRTVLEDALKAHGLSCTVYVERDIYKLAVKRFDQQEVDLKRAITDLGRNLTGPWRAEEKSAALAAWMNLPSSA